MAPFSSTNFVNVIQSSVFRNPLFLHPFDGPGLLCVQEKLVGAQNYRSWRRSIEIALSTKRKLGFIKGIVLRSLDDVDIHPGKQKGKGKATGTSAPPIRTAAAVESGNVVFTSKYLLFFYHKWCYLDIRHKDLVTRKVLGMGKKQVGLYHLLNFPLDQIHKQLSAMVVYALKDCRHVSDSTLKHISCIPHVSKSTTETCLPCPMAKFTKLSFSDSDFHYKVAFHMIHINIWGPYKVLTLGSGYHQKDRKPSQNDKTEHGMEKTVQNQGQSPKMPKSESIQKNQQSNRSRN
ncbi:retrovirus-related pol polyprotein from transposon TNT 1-94 [Tanacetum coccineum]